MTSPRIAHGLRTAWVTGAKGFLGRHVARAFAAAGYRVVGVGNGNWAPLERHAWRVESWIAGPIASSTLDALAEVTGAPDVVFHAAGSGSVAASLAAPFDDFTRSVTSTAAVLDFLRRHAPSASFILPSSAAIYGVQPDGPIDEDAQPAPVSPYGVHKLMAESVCRLYARSFGARTVIIRYFSLYGPPLRKQLFWDLATRAAHAPAEIELFGTGRETRDLMHVEDAARLAVLLAPRTGSEPLVVNGGTGIAVTISDAAETFLRQFGYGGRIRFSGAARPGDPQHYCASTAHLCEFGFSPTWGFERGLAEYAAWTSAELTGTPDRTALA